MVHPQPCLRLPLVHHLVQQGVLDLGPAVPRNVPPADRKLDWAAGLDVHRKLAQAAAHSGGESDPDFVEQPAEVPEVEVAMKRLQPVEQEQVTGAGTLPAGGPLRRGVLLDRKPKELPLSGPSKRPRNPGIEEPNNRLKHAIRSGRVAPMHSEHPPLKTEHHRTIGMGHDPINVSQTELVESSRELIVQEK
jgi:hypothetical protein